MGWEDQSWTSEDYARWDAEDRKNQNSKLESLKEEFKSMDFNKKVKVLSRIHKLGKGWEDQTPEYIRDEYSSYVIAWAVRELKRRAAKDK